MIVLTPTVFECLICMRFLFFCICSCSAQLSMFHMEKRSRNTLIIIIIIRRLFCWDVAPLWKERHKSLTNLLT